MTFPATIRVAVKANFPAIITTSGFIQISKANGVWTVGANFAQLLTLPPSLVTATSVLPIEDTVGGAFYSLSLTALIAFVASSIGAAAPPKRIVTAGVAGHIAALITDGDILVNLTVPAAVIVDLVASSTATQALCIKDYAGNASTNNITITPNGSEKIDGLTGSIKIASDGGSVTLYPISGTGWYSR